MATPDKKHSTAEHSVPSSNLFTSTPLEIKSTLTAELVISLCGPIGSPLHKVGNTLKKILEDNFNYKCEIIKLSAIISEKTIIKSHAASEFERIQRLINNGNDLRKKYGNSVLADLAIAKISYGREKEKSDDKPYESRRNCYIIDSIKNQDELEALRSVYRDMFYFLGVFSPLPIREKNLKDKGITIPEVYKLINRDSGEEIDHGQTVEETFPNADFFLRVDSSSDLQIKAELDRFLKLIFGVEISTPSHGETAMYMASSAAGNSACLSRQVGAALTDNKGELISVGWNDVPKADGNLYQYFPDKNPASGYDKRCTNLDGGKCFNDIEKKRITEEIVEALATEGVISRSDTAKAITIIQNSTVKNLLEFSRSIHAEMHAIILGSQAAGNRVRGGKLYCTTYPCHSCARHIIASGIKEVYYIEPYRKSLALRLHGDDITENESEEVKVRILPFNGVAPSRYLKIFRMLPGSRKDNLGNKIPKDPRKARPVYEVTLESLPALEGIVVNRLVENQLIEAQK